MAKREEALGYLSGEQRRRLEAIVQQLHSKRQFGELGEVIGLLFGLTTGLMHWQGIRGQATTKFEDSLRVGRRIEQSAILLCHDIINKPTNVNTAIGGRAGIGFPFRNID